MKRQKFIVYTDSDPDNFRKIVVIDGQPYYQSTGQNSGAPGVWFPFIMIAGSKPINLDNLPAIYDKDYFLETFIQADPDYILKFNTPMLSSDYAELKQLLYNGRIPTKSTLITSCRLGLAGHDFESILKKAKLNLKEFYFAKQTIRLAKKPVFKTEDPEKINQWLIEQGAKTVERLLTLPILSQSSASFFKNNDNDENQNDYESGSVNTSRRYTL